MISWRVTLPPRLYSTVSTTSQTRHTTAGWDNNTATAPGPTTQYLWVSGRNYPLHAPAGGHHIACFQSPRRINKSSIQLLFARNIYSDLLANALHFELRGLHATGCFEIDIPCTSSQINYLYCLPPQSPTHTCACRTSPCPFPWPGGNCHINATY